MTSKRKLRAEIERLRHEGRKHGGRYNLTEADEVTR